MPPKFGLQNRGRVFVFFLKPQCVGGGFFIFFHPGGGPPPRVWDTHHLPRASGGDVRGGGGGRFPQGFADLRGTSGGGAEADGIGERRLNGQRSKAGLKQGPEGEA